MIWGPIPWIRSSWSWLSKKLSTSRSRTKKRRRSAPCKTRWTMSASTRKAGSRLGSTCRRYRARPDLRSRPHHQGSVGEFTCRQERRGPDYAVRRVAIRLSDRGGSQELRSSELRRKKRSKENGTVHLLRSGRL